MDRELEDIQEILELHRKRLERLERSLGSRTRVAYANGQTWYDSSGGPVGFNENATASHANAKPKSNGPTLLFPIALIFTVLDLFLLLHSAFIILNPPTYTVYRPPLEIFGITIIKGGEVTLIDWGELALAWLRAISGVLMLPCLIDWVIDEALGGDRG